MRAMLNPVPVEFLLEHFSLGGKPRSLGECHRKFIELHVSSCRSLVTLSCRLYGLGSYSQETNMGLLLTQLVRELYM